MRIAYCGHSYHRTTGSSEFILEALRAQGQVDTYWDEEWLTKVPMALDPVLQGGYDVVVVWQLVSVARRLAAAGSANLTLFPMYDGCHAEPDSSWRSLASVKIVSFSSTLHEHLQRLGLTSRHLAYALDPDRYPPADHGLGLRGFFWHRQQEITWRTIRPLIERSAFDGFTLHQAMDPGYGEVVRPTPEDVARFGIRTTQWYASREEARADLANHTVYFAPRLREGIGMSFLEAMAMGLLVVAPDRPTMSEYIVSGVNGLLYDPDRPLPLDLGARRAIGERARGSLHRAWERWSRSRQAMLDFVLEPRSPGSTRAPYPALDPLAVKPARAGGGPARRSQPLPPGAARVRPPGAADLPPPQVTVVVSADAESGLSATLDSVLAQDHPSLELAVVADGSRDGTAEVLRAYEGQLDSCHRGSESGGFGAVNEAAQAARGRYVVFLRGGDRLLTSDALSQALAGAPADADVIYGHHVQRDELGYEDLRRAGDFRELWRLLREGQVGASWQSAIPGPQATLFRTELLRANPYRAEVHLAGHLELLCRLAAAGARFHHSLATVVACGPGGDGRRALQAQLRVALEHTHAPDQVRKAFRDLRRDLARAELPHLTGWQLVGRLGRVPGATRALKRRLRSLSWRAVGGLRRHEVLLGEDSPAQLLAATGLSTPEGWGCWTDGPLVTLDLDPALMASARQAYIQIRQVFGPNVGQSLTVRTGPQREEHTLAAGRQRLNLACDALRRMELPRVELEIPCPASPHDLGVGADVRKLGLALECVVIESRAARPGPAARGR